MKILVVSNNYPSLEKPARGTFVYNLVQQFCKLGHEVTVICPKNILSIGAKKVKSYGVENCTVYRPLSFSLSNKQIGFFNTYRITEIVQIKGIKRIAKKHNLEFDFVYAHFMTNGIIAVNALKKYNKPFFVAIGENDLTKLLQGILNNTLNPKDYFKQSIMQIRGYIAVSNKLKNQLIDDYGISKNRILMKPNAVDLTKFYKRNKVDMRKKYKLPMDIKLVAFVGRFEPVKGPLRVLEAVQNLDNVGALFLGSGYQEPEGTSVFFKGSVPSYQIPELLSAADLFVLPTQKEGSCNAIVEAIACGLPVVSSNIPEVMDQCNPSFSILVNPLDVKAIERAIESILSDEERIAEMSNNALKHSKNFEIGERALSILDFIQGKLEE
ncbi:glycosyltransferase family 4 protein [Croceitalea sp. MTPC9]|uniref:glycosyltransferase family 4 protein n=1 Tax=unclassified Croceitalea TaxID=2632280 RepID=UPI002B37EB4D|nr:glycosyltransferase family 4 protein [Croceitalea sp. MTPC6]GMN15998.1 glycosyltransferase family 4 protein [Croceitalea sp. MTPC9]